MAGSKYSVSWGAYQKSICSGLSSLQQRGEFVDMTLAADGHHVKVHQMVLSLVSPYIRDLISSAACPHPVIFLNKISYETLQAILQYAYTGEVVVANDKIQEFLNACKDLHIRGLESMNSFGDSEINEESVHTAPKPKQADTSEKEKDTSHTKKRGRNRLHSNTDVKPLQCKVNTVDCFDDDDDDMKSPFDSDSGELLTENESKTVPKMSIGDTDETTLKYTMSTHGTLQLVLNRYLYCFKYTTIKNGHTIWRCIDFKKKCSARIAVKNNRIVRRLCAHNHPFHDAPILKRLRSRNMFTTMSEVERAIDTRKKENDARNANEKTKQPIMPSLTI